MPHDLTINKKYLLLSWALALLGFAGTITLPVPIKYFMMPLLGGLGLYLLIGTNQIQEILRPLKKPYLLKMIGFFFLLPITSIVIRIFAVLIGQFDSKHAVSDKSVDVIVQGDLPFRLFKLLCAVFQIIGEELVMAVVVLSIFYFMKKISHGWLIATLIGCLIFSFMHLWAYDFQIWVCLSVGFARLPLNLAWEKTNSFRAPIYLHLMFDLIEIIPLVLTAK